MPTMRPSAERASTRQCSRVTPRTARHTASRTSGRRADRAGLAVDRERLDAVAGGGGAERGDDRLRGVERREAWHAALDGGAPDEEAVALHLAPERRRVHHGGARAGADELDDGVR